MGNYSRTDWIDFSQHVEATGMQAYRIHKRCVDGRWQQCHEWMAEDGTIRADGWIASAGKHLPILSSSPTLAAPDVDALREELSSLAEQHRCDCGHPACNRCADYVRAKRVLAG